MRTPRRGKTPNGTWRTLAPTRYHERMDTSSPCPTAASQTGAHIPCQLEARHSGWAHSNTDHELIWAEGPTLRGPVTETGEAHGGGITGPSVWPPGTVGPVFLGNDDTQEQADGPTER